MADDARAFPMPREAESVEVSDSYVVDEDRNEDVLQIALGDEYASYFQANDDPDDPVLKEEQMWEGPRPTTLAPERPRGDPPPKKQRTSARDRLESALGAADTRKLIGKAIAMVDHLSKAIGTTDDARKQVLAHADRKARLEWTKAKTPDTYAAAFMRNVPADFA